MRILLTGSTGLIGSAVYAALTVNHEVIRLGRTPGHYDFYLDLANPSSEPLPACDVLVHCAGVIDEDFSDNSLARLSSIASGADYLAQAAVKAGAKRAIYISSSHVYGRQEGVIDESSSINPLSYYAITHFCTEQLFKKAFSGDSQATLILRPNAVYGPLVDVKNFKRWTLIPFSFPLEAFARNSITLKSAGIQRRNFVSTATIANVISNWLLTPISKSNVICHPLGHVTESVYEFAKRCTGITSEIMQSDGSVKRPLESPQKAFSFEYLSTLPTEEDEHALDNYIKYLTNDLSLNKEWADEKASQIFL
jgi:UDP-glucose 4-epimerase